MLAQSCYFTTGNIDQVSLANVMRWDLSSICGEALVQCHLSANRWKLFLTSCALLPKSSKSFVR